MLLMQAWAIPAQAEPRKSWPQPAQAPKGAPNVLIIMTDDVGFGSASAFGGPVPTPTFDALAREGLRYNRFHTTAICSPTRAALLTGRNPQAVGVGYTTNWPTPYEGYNSFIPDSAGTLAQVLRANGYGTAMFGKGHITPEWEMSQAGPFDRWPTGLGFDYFYGFLGADTSAFEPSLIENTRPVLAPAVADYHLDRDLADRAIGWIAEQRAIAPDKPFFVYFAPGTAHAPNHAPKAVLDRFRGLFDNGWDELRDRIVARQRRLGLIPPGTADAPRPETLPRWSSLSSDQRRTAARYMEAYAASLAYADEQIGRVIQQLKDSGAYENTVVIYIQGDNGATAEGSFDGKLYEQSALSGVKEDPARATEHIDTIGTRDAYNLLPGGWGWAMNAPFPLAKRYASHLGGVRNGMVLSWPGRIKDPGGLRSQYLHVSDVMPTVLDIVGIAPPEVLEGVRQQPLTGISARYTLASPDAPSRRTNQIYAMAGNLAFYRDGWLAATAPAATPWERQPPPAVPIEARTWELYNLDRDFSQAHNLADRHPDKLDELRREFWAQAEREKILPIHRSEGNQQGRPDLNRGRNAFVYTLPVAQIHESAAPHTVGRSFTILADIEVPEGGGAGVLLAQGGRYGGFSLWLDRGRPSFTFNLTPAHMTRVAAPAPLEPGRRRVTVTVSLDREEPTSGAAIAIGVDSIDVASGRIQRSFAQVVSHTEGLDIGQDLISPVDPRYDTAASRFTGRIRRIEVVLKPEWGRE